MIVSRNMGCTGRKRLADSFLTNVYSKLPKEIELEFTGVSCDQSGVVKKHREELFTTHRILSANMPKNVSLQALYTEEWMGVRHRYLHKVVTQKVIDAMRLGARIFELLPYYDIVHWFELFAPTTGITACRSLRRGIKNFATLFSIYARWPSYNWILKLSLKNLTKVIVSTNAVADYLVKFVNINSSRVEVFPLGVNLRLYKPAENKQRLKEMAGLANNTVVTWFGPIENTSYNDYLFWMKATQTMKDLPIKFLFAFKDNIPNSHHGLYENIRLYRNLDGIIDLLNLTDLVVHPFTRPDWKAGLPLTIIEALACGIPIIATKRPGLDEAIINNANGFLLEHITDFPQVVKSIIEDKQRLKDMSFAAREHAESYFNIDNVVSAYLDLWSRN